LPPTGVLTGGVGEFRNEVRAAALLRPLASTGRGGDATQVTCVGAAAPVPDWRAYAASPASIPASCVSGATPLADQAPNMAFFDPSYDAARSWRGNLQWSSAIRKLHYSVNAQYSYNIDQPGTVDANFANAARFALSSEAGRPVF